MTAIITEQTLHERAGALAAVGRWSAANESLPWKPTPDSQPWHWSYKDLRPVALAAAAMVKGDDAALRVLTLTNPGHTREAAVGHLYSGLQIINPGEAMTPHRHAATALRYMHEGDGAWTGIDGTVIHLDPRDVVVTPAERWHEHGNMSPTGALAIWQDCTNDPLVNALAATRFELHPDTTHMSNRSKRTSPLHYPWKTASRALGRLARSSRPDPNWAHRLPLRHAQTTGPITSTTAAAFTLIPPHTTTAPIRRTCSATLIASSGHGQVRVGDAEFEVNEGDTVACPSWAPLSYDNPTADALIIFEFNDSPALAALRLYREQKDNV